MPRLNEGGGGKCFFPNKDIGTRWGDRLGIRKYLFSRVGNLLFHSFVLRSFALVALLKSAMGANHSCCSLIKEHMRDSL